MEKQLYLFGEEVIETNVNRKSRREVIEDYEAFLDKHDKKKTTDDCYTPPEVYEVVKEFAGTLMDLTDKQIIRPFYPGGDYKAEAYPDNSVVIDNPPFSIITQITRWYEAAGIKYFMFAPHLTCFNSWATCTILTDANIRYANGAVVKTSFITNFIDDPRVWLCPSLKNKLNAVAGASEHPTEKKNYPANAINSAQMGKFLSRGVEIKMPKDECVLIGNLDELSRVGMKIFGGGVIFSDRIAEEMQRHKATFERDVELSARERRIVEQLNKKEL